MTILGVHDIQQKLANDFVKMVKSTLQNKNQFHEKKEQIYITGQEMGFCNDEIDVLLEELVVELPVGKRK